MAAREVRIRDAGPADAGALARLLAEFNGVDTSAAQVRSRLSGSAGIEQPILAERLGAVAGFASLRLLHYLGEDAPYAELSELFVSADCRRQGVGRALVAELERRARAVGASSWNVFTGADNEAALALYRGVGFREFAVVLQKWITSARPYREQASE